jgi:hypothetical protein
MSGPRVPFDAFGVEQAIRVAVPEVLFAAPRVVRRIIRADRDLPLFTRPPHRDIAVVASRRLADLTDDVWALPADLPDSIALVARPQGERYDAAGPEPVLREYWRLVFHALLDMAAARVVAAGDADAIAAWVGATRLDEAKTVLLKEGLLPHGADDRAALAEFMAVFLELRCFAPASVPVWFPSLDDPDALAERLSGLVGAERLLERALPPMLDPEAADQSPAAAPRAPDRIPTWRAAWFRPRPSALRRRADRTALRGNFVRAALDEWRAVTIRGTGPAPAVRSATGRFARLVDSFARRLGWALGLDAAAVDDAVVVIGDMVERTGGSPWTPPARLLYDLQKICVDSERESFRTHLIGWLVSLGRRPLATPLPCQRLVLIHRHALAAAARVPTLRLPEPLRHRTDRLLAAAVETTDAAAREALRPRIETALRDAGLVPDCLVEEAAFEKLVDELLDAVMDRGFVSFGSVRDAVSRNQLKLPDLAGVGEWLAGDPMLRLDARLAATLDGVYRRAPLYLAAMQRLSAPAFGTAGGRLLTTHVLVPFGGAWIILRGLEHVIEPLSAYSLGEMWHVYTRGRMLAIGCGLWALIHLPTVRAALAQTLRGVAAAAHFIAVVIPARVLQLPAVARFLRSRPVRWFVRHASSPLVVTAAVWLVLPRHGRWMSRETPWVPPAVLAANAVLLNSRAGRHLQELVVEAAGRAVHQFHLHVLVGLFSWIVDAFRRAMDFLEGTLYAVDESLRFRSDESGLTLAVKAMLGAVWSIVEAFVRFCVTLLIEPQLNPIKHFPVVTVSHKLLVPMIPMVAGQVAAATGVEKGMAITAVTFVSTCIPGVFGFLAWELKENWRLYAANRPRTLRPAQVGHHGETIRRLLVPGFHSGTVPRIFARLRREDARGGPRPEAATTTRAQRQVRQLEHDIGAFLARDVLALVERTEAGRGLAIHVSAVKLGVNRISIALAADGVAGDALVVDLIERDGRIESRLVAPGWLRGLPAAGRDVATLAHAGFHRLAAADTASAGVADMPPASAADLPGAPVALEPIEWSAWRVAWERAR